eukprot:7399462-Pyramimonas_sp.AAC.1
MQAALHSAAASTVAASAPMRHLTPPCSAARGSVLYHLRRLLHSEGAAGFGKGVPPAHENWARSLVSTSTRATAS